MTRQDAHRILDRVRAGENVSVYLINLALLVTGDIYRRTA